MLNTLKAYGVKGVSASRFMINCLFHVYLRLFCHRLLTLPASELAWRPPANATAHKNNDREKALWQPGRGIGHAELVLRLPMRVGTRTRATRRMTSASMFLVWRRIWLMPNTESRTNAHALKHGWNMLGELPSDLFRIIRWQRSALRSTGCLIVTTCRNDVPKALTMVIASYDDPMEP